VFGPTGPTRRRRFRGQTTNVHFRKDNKESEFMKRAIAKWAVPMLLAAAVPTALFAQAQQPPPPARARLSADTMARLQDGRFAMIKESLKLNDAQLKLWSPVEAQMRAAAAARAQRREERIKQREQGLATPPPSLPDRLELASKRVAERAERMKAFAEAFKPFYASLSEEQKATADVLLRRMHGGRGRWAMRHAAGAH
jgi:LTXXQ motif family protein